jgi:hypothetical protein
MVMQERIPVQGLTIARSGRVFIYPFSQRILLPTEGLEVRTFSDTRVPLTPNLNARQVITQAVRMIIGRKATILVTGQRA